jgi:hypothetical protein
MAGIEVDVVRFVDTLIAIALDTGCVAAMVHDETVVFSEGAFHGEISTEAAGGKVRMICARMAILFGGGSPPLYGGHIKEKQRIGQTEAEIDLYFRNDAAPWFRLTVVRTTAEPGKEHA